MATLLPQLLGFDNVTGRALVQERFLMWEFCQVCLSKADYWWTPLRWERGVPFRDTYTSQS